MMVFHVTKYMGLSTTPKFGTWYLSSVIAFPTIRPDGQKPTLKSLVMLLSLLQVPS